MERTIWLLVSVVVALIAAGLLLAFVFRSLSDLKPQPIQVGEDDRGIGAAGSYSEPRAPGLDLESVGRRLAARLRRHTPRARR